MPYLDFHLKPSRYYLVFFFTVTLISAVTVVGLPLAGSIKFFMLTLVCVYGLSLSWRVGLLKGKRAVTCLRHHHDGSWQVLTGNQFFAAELRGDSTVTRLVSVLRFRLKERCATLSCVIFCDALPETEAYRRLLVVMRRG